MNASDSAYIGREFGRFRVLSFLGRGGLASVWRAHDPLLGRDVALKVLNADVMESSKARTRFVREPQTTALMDHPAVVTTFDTGETDGLAWIALALIEGQTLSELARERLMPLGEALRIATTAADALAHAHAHNVLHRDVTGRNIMVSRDGRVFVLDFGLALRIDETRLTTTETTLGTIPYMAPEALAARPVDARGDVYGLGVVLFEALTGTVPFTADRIEAVAFAKLNEDPRGPRELRTDVPESLDRLVRRAIARDVNKRFPTMTALADALREQARQLVLEAPAHSPSPSHTPVPPALDPRRADRPRDPVYLAIMPFTIEAGSVTAEDDAIRASVGPLAEVLASDLGSEPWIRVVSPIGDSTPDESLAALAARWGANAMLRGTMRRAGVRVRLVWTLFASDGSTRLVGDVVDGTIGQMFEFEDAVVSSVRRALGLGSRDSGTARTRPADPAAEDKYRTARGYLTRYDHAGSVDGAIQVLEKLADSAGVRASHVATLGRAYLLRWRQNSERHDENLAARSCERALTIDSDDPEAQLLRAELHASAGRVAEARAGFESVLQRRLEDIDARVGLIRLLEQESRWDQAEAACVEVVRDFPEDWRGPMRLGLVRFSRGNFEGAVEAWSRVIELVPESAWGYRNLGSALYHLDRFDEAERAYQRALAIRPDAIAYANLGTIHFYRGRFAEAVETFEHATALRPSDPLALGNLGNAYRWMPGRETAMRETLGRAVALMRDRLEGHSQDAEGRARLAGWLMNLGRRDEAFAELRRALADAPEDVGCLARAGYVHADDGDHQAAIHWFREAIRRGYGTRELERSPVLAALRQDPEFRRVLGEGRTRIEAS